MHTRPRLCVCCDTHRHTQLEGETQRYRASALKLLKAGHKDRAKLMLQMKKYAEKQVAATDGQLMRLQEMVSTVEWESTQLEVFNGLKAGNAALKLIQDELSVEDAELILEETAEAQAQVDEINEMLGGKLSEDDDEDILAELEEIEKLEADTLGLSMPEAPKDAVAAATGVAGGAGAAAAAAPAAAEAEAEAEAAPERVAVAV